MCSKQGKPSVPVHLTLMPSSSVGRNSDPFLGLPVLLEHSTSAWHKCQPKKCHQTFVLRYNEFGIVRTHWSLKAKVTVMDNIPPDSHPINRMRIGRFSAVPSCSLINWRNRLDSVASHTTRHAEDHMGHRKCWRKIGETLRLRKKMTDQKRMNKVYLQLCHWILTPKRSRNLVILEELWCI